MMDRAAIAKLGKAHRPLTLKLERDTREARMEIIGMFIKMRKAGIIAAVHCDDHRLSFVPIAEEFSRERQPISWANALLMAEEFEESFEDSRSIPVERKPPMRAGIPGEAKLQCRK